MKTRKSIIGNCVSFSLALALLILLSSPASAMLPPEARAEICHSSGGLFLDGICHCPPFISSSLWDMCWLTNPESACTNLGGTVSYQLVVGPSGAGFTCTLNDQDITSQASDSSRKYNITYSLIILLMVIIPCYMFYKSTKSKKTKK